MSDTGWVNLGMTSFGIGVVTKGVKDYFSPPGGPALIDAPASRRQFSQYSQPRTSYVRRWLGLESEGDVAHGKEYGKYGKIRKQRLRSVRKKVLRPYKRRYKRRKYK